MSEAPAPTAPPISSADNDESDRFREIIRAAHAANSKVYLRGGNSKRVRMGRCCSAEPLDIAGHRGVVSYHPEEMVITARAGTPIEELQAITGAHKQHLPFEPAEFAGKATIGGCLASGLSGAARPWCGSGRDAVLGIRLINGVGEQLRFGGEVMKNVAGYDVSRLQAGAFGTLGLITEVSIRVMPVAESSCYLETSLEQHDALTHMRTLAQRPWPITGMFWHADKLYLRLQGKLAALAALRNQFGEFIESDVTPWLALREWTLDELRSPQRLCIVDGAPNADLTKDRPAVLIDWGGARRYVRLKEDESVNDLQACIEEPGAHAIRLGAGDQDDDIVATPPEPLRALQGRVKHALDPASVFNPGRLYAWL
ncbi:MAG: glycolate oxidase subunit GlcE [Congregibacter sp.]